MPACSSIPYYSFVRLAKEAGENLPLQRTTVIDVGHIKPHRGDRQLFWDRGNWQPLCEHHHDVRDQLASNAKKLYRIFREKPLINQAIPKNSV